MFLDKHDETENEIHVANIDLMFPAYDIMMVG